MADRAGEVRVGVTVSFVTTLPADAEERARIYGRTNFAECIAIDIKTDPAFTFAEAEDLKVEEAVRVE